MVVDFHTHILPEVDDGSASIEESLALLSAQMQQGIQCVIATPHFYAHHDKPERFLRRRQMAADRLRAAVGEQNGYPQIKLGAEVYFFSGMSDSESLNHLTIGEKKYILLEMPFVDWTNQFFQEMEAIYIKQGITPIIAHVDRYIRPFRTCGIPERLMDLPVLVQANASFFTKASTRRMALRMLSRDQIHLLGSDCHNMSTRKPNLGEAVEIILDRLGPEAVERINSYERTVLSNLELR